MKKMTKKLSLSRETLKTLGRGALGEAAGGTDTDVNTCTAYTCTFCWVTGPDSECVSRCVVCPEPAPTEFAFC